MEKTARVDAVERSIEQANAWLGEVAAQLGTDDHGYAYRVLRGFLHTVRDRMTIEETADLAAQLPGLLRGVFFEGWRPSRAIEAYSDPGTFLDQLSKEAILHGSTEASYAAAAAAAVLRRHLAAAESDGVIDMLPPDARRLLDPEDG